MSRYRRPRFRRRQNRRQRRARGVVRNRNRAGHHVAMTTGSLYVKRKISPIQIYCNGLGTVTKNDPSGNCLTLGTPVAVTGTAAVFDIPFSMKFNMNQAVNATEFTSIADSYKLYNAYVRIHNNYVNTSVGTNGVQPWIEYYQDHDDATVPAVSDVRERMNTKTKYFTADKPMVPMGVRPKVADAIFNNGVATGYSQGTNSWIDCAYPAVEHYSIKGLLRNVPLIGSGALFDVDVQLAIGLRDIQ